MMYIARAALGTCAESVVKLLFCPCRHRSLLVCLRGEAVFMRSVDG